MLGPSDFGVAAGLPVADASATLLDDGRIRIYVFAQEKGILSAISADGAAFQAEEGQRIAGQGAGMPRVVRLSDGRFRMFFINMGGISSAISDDGLNFTTEPGMRITADAAGFTGGTTAGMTSGATIVTLPDGSYRMYFSDLPRPGDPPGNHRIKSATSTDMLNWTVEEGVRIGLGAPALTGSAEHPSAFVNADGSITLFYGRFTGPGSNTQEGMYQSTSPNGLDFTEEIYSGLSFGNDPDALQQLDGTLLLYYGTFSPEVGGTVRVAKCSG